ncbi:MAG: ammonium transporter, partial [Nitrosopumilaceae archaeon]
MSEIGSRTALQITKKYKWPLIFALSALIVTVSGLTAVQEAHAQFGALNTLASPTQTKEVHCGQPMQPPGNGTFGGSYAPCIDTGDTTFMYIAAVIVMIMTPGGLGFLYGGLTRRKHALTVILQEFITYAIVSVQWVLWGYGMLFGPSADPYGFVGNLNWVGLNNVFNNAPADVYATTIPHLGYAMFQLMFAAITPALAIAGYADRVKMSAFLIHVVLWSTFIYDIVGHANWSLGSQGTAVGWLANIGTEDFAGGTVIHITSGFGGLASAMFLGRRIGYGKAPFEPHSLPLMMLGAILLWYGWFGFNPGSSGFAGFLETEAFQNTNLATAVAAIWWMFLSWAHTGKTSAVGAASGAVAGLVAITPASGYV